MSLLRNRCTIRSKTDDGAMGPVWTTTRNVPCRFEGKRRQVRRPDGTDVISSASITVGPRVTVAPEDEIIVDGRTYEVQDVLVMEGLSRPAGFEVLVA